MVRFLGPFSDLGIDLGPLSSRRGSESGASCLLSFLPIFFLFAKLQCVVSRAKMAASLQRRVLPFGCSLFAQARSLSSEALVEIKPGEVGIVSGIPKEQLKRKVLAFLSNFLCLSFHIEIHSSRFVHISLLGMNLVYSR
jgi:hypothetical protein